MTDTMQKIVVLFIFAACCALIVLVHQPDTGNSVVQLLILAGMVVSFLDRQVKATTTIQKLDENTALTAKTEKQLNGKTEDLIRAASQAAYAKGLLDGQEQERQRQKDALSTPPTP
jgi:hypothetical protein